MHATMLHATMLPSVRLPDSSTRLRAVMEHRLMALFALAAADVPYHNPNYNTAVPDVLFDTVIPASESPLTVERHFVDAAHPYVANNQQRSGFQFPRADSRFQHQDRVALQNVATAQYLVCLNGAVGSTAEMENATLFDVSRAAWNASNITLKVHGANAYLGVISSSPTCSSSSAFQWGYEVSDAFDLGSRGSQAALTWADNPKGARYLRQKPKDLSVVFGSSLGSQQRWTVYIHAGVEEFRPLLRGVNINGLMMMQYKAGYSLWADPETGVNMFGKVGTRGRCPTAAQHLAFNRWPHRRPRRAESGTRTALIALWVTTTPSLLSWVKRRRSIVSVATCERTSLRRIYLGWLTTGSTTFVCRRGATPARHPELHTPVFIEYAIPGCELTGFLLDGLP